MPGLNAVANVLMEISICAFTWEFWGMSFITPVTVAGNRLPVSNMVCPTGLISPKYFCDSDSENTTVFGAVNAVFGLPYFNGRSKMENKDPSAHKAFSSWKLILFLMTRIF